MSMIHRLTFGLIFALFASVSHGQTFSSTNKQVNLIELYTSEGCSSCPPADKWLNKLASADGLWTRFIPLAFHVDYWDYIGWKDPYAQPRYTQRQYQYHHADTLRSVYTPAVLVNGQEWRAWRRHEPPNLEIDNAGLLSLTVESDTLSAHYESPLPKNQTLVLNIAILGFDQISQVKNGENVGQSFKHDFVVLAYRTVAMQPEQTRFTINSTTLPKSQIHSTRRAIVTWVNTLASPTPIQATGGWLN